MTVRVKNLLDEITNFPLVSHLENSLISDIFKVSFDYKRMKFVIFIYFHDMKLNKVFCFL